MDAFDNDNDNDNDTDNDTDGGALRSAVARLAIKQGASLGNMSRNDMLLAIALAARCLPEGQTRDEAGVNAVLKDWLAGPGAMLRVDHVELRRTLVDYALWQRDGYGRSYQRGAPLDETLLSIAQALNGIDAESALLEARATHEAQREARRRAHETRETRDGKPGS